MGRRATGSARETKGVATAGEGPAGKDKMAGDQPKESRLPPDRDWEPVRGRSNEEIAGLLGITEATVKCHVSVILSRLGVEDRTQAVVTALQRGIVRID